MNDITLLFPTKLHEAAAAGYYQEHVSAGESTLHGDSGLDSAKSYDEWLVKIAKDMTTDVTSIIFFAIRPSDQKLIGTINIRFPYAGYVQTYGHIGYGVRPSERRKGYAAAMLRLALAYCKKIGLNKVLLTCYAGNAASEKTILSCGGVLEGEMLLPDGDVSKRYWIEVI